MWWVALQEFQPIYYNNSKDNFLKLGVFEAGEKNSKGKVAESAISLKVFEILQKKFCG